MILSRTLLFRNFSRTLWLAKACCSHQSYKNTLTLPKTSFPHKVNAKNRRERDIKIERDANFYGLYSTQQTLKRNKKFILHDGPPYANGEVHIGHAVNKILKDITVRHALLRGNEVCFTPGWDCHGLPIELKILKENRDYVSTLPPLEIRRKGYEFSQKIIKTQKTSFQKWGILADWENKYITCNKNYIIQQLNIFQDLYDKELIFRDHKPVFWSPENRTSLAEAELEYNANHVSPSVFVKFPVRKCPDSLKACLKPNTQLNIVIWTTTPWSLPANQAVCYAANKRYCILFCDNQNEYYVIAEEMVESFKLVLKTNFTILFTFEGSLLEHVTYQHPILKNKECPLFSAHHVTMEKGTGLVHTAPNHGLDDYNVAKDHKLILDPCLVDERGCYNNYAIEDLQGEAVIGKGSKIVLDLLKEDILHIENYVHSYPYDWRSKTPVIIRSCHQWFVDVNRIRAKAMECLKDVNIIPDRFEKVFVHQLQSSPQWCISRQRSWGVPIPAFYAADTDKPIVDRNLTNYLCSLIETHGIHCWWEKDVDELIPSDLKKTLPVTELRKGSDIMDIWFDSGISWKCVLPDPFVSDVCIEGIDQIRGWFNSSLLTSVAVRGKAPYKTLMVHGFTTDSEGRKMSKSEGNVISPEDILSGSKKLGTPSYGIDVLRWWVASHACQAENVPVKKEILEECSQSINKLRNVLKFLLGNLYEFDPELHLASAAEMRSLDIYTMFLVLDFTEKVNKQYTSLQYKGVAKDILNFVTNEVSSFYCHLIKDRLYCDSQFSKSRLDCQNVLYHILIALLQALGPICPHLSEEIFLCLTSSKESKSLFTHSWPSLNEFLGSSSFPRHLEWANQVREAILKSEVKTNDMEAIITCRAIIAESLKKLNEKCPDSSGLNEFFQVASVKFAEKSQASFENSTTLTGDLNVSGKGDSENFSVTLVKTAKKKCSRCRLYASNSETVLCHRCDCTLSTLAQKQAVSCK